MELIIILFVVSIMLIVVLLSVCVAGICLFIWKFASDFLNSPKHAGSIENEKDEHRETYSAYIANKLKNDLLQWDIDYCNAPTQNTFYYEMGRNFFFAHKRNPEQSELPAGLANKAAFSRGQNDMKKEMESEL